jgi:hypothetical protein
MPPAPEVRGAHRSGLRAWLQVPDSDVVGSFGSWIFFLFRDMLRGAAPEAPRPPVARADRRQKTERTRNIARLQSLG